MYYFLQFSKPQYTLKKITHSKKFSFQRNWEQIKKICFAKYYQLIKLIFQFKHGKVKYQIVFLCIFTTLTDNSRSVNAFSFPPPYFTTNLGNNNKSAQT